MQRKMSTTDDRIKEKLKDAVSELFPSEELKERIDAAVSASDMGTEREKKMRKKNVVKAAVVALACVALSGSTVYAVGQASGWYGSSTAYEYTAYSDLEKAAKKADLTLNLPEEFSNGYTFAYASVSEFGEQDELGNAMSSYKGVDVSYSRGEESVIVTVEPPVGEDYGDDAIEEREIAPGVTAYYDCHEMLILPNEDYELSPEDKERQENDPKFWVSYGSDQEERKIMSDVAFVMDGQNYLLMAVDSSLTAEDLFAMAGEIAAR